MGKCYFATKEIIKQLVLFVPLTFDLHCRYYQSYCICTHRLKNTLFGCSRQNLVSTINSEECLKLQKKMSKDVGQNISGGVEAVPRGSSSNVNLMIYFTLSSFIMNYKELEFQGATHP